MNDDYQHRVKICFVGDAETGKSSLVSRFVDDEFDSNYTATIGGDCRCRIIAHKCTFIKLEFWDLAGQERFQTITRSFYRNNDGFVVVFDVTDMDSFNHVNHWMESIAKIVNTNPILALVGNKCDLNSRRVVDVKMGLSLANKYGIPFVETVCPQRVERR